MKRLLGFAFTLALCSMPAFAAQNSQAVMVPQAVTVGSAQLPAGHYKVSWTGSGPSVQVILKQLDVRTPATATIQAKLVSQNHDHAAVTVTSQGRVSTIEQIQLNHVSLILGSGPSSGQ